MIVGVILQPGIYLYEHRLYLLMKGVHLQIGGKVQGVFFRAFTRDLANSLGICGFDSKRAPDGR